MSWTCIQKKDYELFLDQYPILKEHRNDIILKEFDTVLFLPKLFITNFKSQYLTNYGGRRAISAQMIEGIAFNGTLRSEQQKAFDAIVAYYKVHNKINGMLKLATGAGKTVLGLYTIAATRLKTIIIVDNEDLLNEWERSIYEFTNLTKQNVGLIKGNVFDVNKSIVIASSQTLVSKLKNDFDNFFTVFDNAGFGLAIFDEAHATSATVNTAKINVLLRTNNILGLSATPYHTGIQLLLMNNTIGVNLYNMTHKEVLPVFNIVYYNSHIEKIKKSFVIYKLADLIQQRSVYNNIVVGCPEWSAIILKIVKYCMKKDHSIIIICMTKAQVIEVSNKLSSSAIQHRRYYGDEKELDRVNDRLLVVTFKFCHKGFNIPHLTAGIIATPISGKKSIPQIIGRVLRPGEDKIQREIFDLFDLSMTFLMHAEFNRKKYILNSEYKGIEILEKNESSFTI